MLSALLSIPWIIISHSLSLAVGVAIGYLFPGLVSKAIAWVKSKV